MKQIVMLFTLALGMALPARATEPATASAQDLLTLYRQLRTLPSGGESASVENVTLKRDSAAFTFLSGRITFAAPVAGRVLAAHFEGEGRFELDPPSIVNKQQLGRYTGKLKLVDSFREATFFFTDDTFAEIGKLLKMQPAAASDPALFSSKLKQYSEQLNDWWENRRSGRPSMRNMPARMLADLSDPTSKGFFLADFEAKESGDLLFHISWNRDPLLTPAYAKGEEIMLLHLSSKEEFEWWAGYHLASEYSQSAHPDHRSHQADCVNERIDLQIGKGNSISATATMEYTVENPARVLPFNLEGVLRISSIQDGAGAQLAFVQEDRKLDSDPWLLLPQPAKPGEKYTVTLAYSEDSTRDSRIVSQQGAGLYYVTSRASWFPSFGAYDDRANFEITARSPKKYKFVASGTLASSVKEKDNLVTVWKSELPLSVVGFNYGNFVEATQTIQNLSVTAYSGKEVPSEMKDIEHLKSVIELAGGNFEAETGVHTSGFSTAANVKQAAGISVQAFGLYDQLFGPLPFKSVSVTEQPVRGYGQSWPNLIFLPYDAFLDATTRNSLGLQDSGEEREFYNIIAVHEMAHQWWGHLVGWKTYHDQWLSEGIAEFASSLYLRRFQPKEASNFWAMKRTWLLSKNPEGYRPVDAGPVWMNAQLARGNSALIYHKGAYIIEMLRTLMYDTRQQNPDARFIGMMRDFIATFTGKNASTDDFRKIVEKHTGQSMDWFFDQWVYGAITPRYDFSYQLSDAGGGQTELSVTIVQSEAPEGFRMQLPLYAVVNGQARYLGLIGVSGNKPVKSSLKLPLRPEKILLDPTRSILAEINQ